jgi:hypothetical protein
MLYAGRFLVFRGANQQGAHVISDNFLHFDELHRGSANCCFRYRLSLDCKIQGDHSPLFYLLDRRELDLQVSLRVDLPNRDIKRPLLGGLSRKDEFILPHFVINRSISLGRTSFNYEDQTT